MHSPDEPFHFAATVTFENAGNRILLTQKMVFPTKEARDKTIEFGAIEGGKQTLQRLAEYLEK